MPMLSETYFSPAAGRRVSISQSGPCEHAGTDWAQWPRVNFIKGQTARTMDAYFKRIGGKMRYEDFAAHEGEWVEPLCVEYRDLVKALRIAAEHARRVPALQMLQMLERFDLREMGYGSPDALMAQVEAKRLGFCGSCERPMLIRCLLSLET